MADLELRLERDAATEVERPSQADLQVRSEQIVRLSVLGGGAGAAEHRDAQLSGQQRSGPVAGVQSQGGGRRNRKRRAGCSGQGDEDSAFEADLELARGRDETAQLDAIACIEL